MLLIHFFLLDGPISGYVRLFHGPPVPVVKRGIIEVYISELDEWRNVADDGSWSREDGNVICRQMGFDIPGKALSSHTEHVKLQFYNLILTFIISLTI